MKCNSKYTNLLTCLLLLILTNGCSDKKTIEFDDVQGTWVNAINDYFEIQAPGSKLGNSNFVCINGNGNNKYFELLGDTMSFQNRYYSSETNFEKLYIDKFDFRIYSVSDSFLTIRPISDKSIKLFQNRDTIRLIKQKYAIDSTIQFDRIIFHTTNCFGHCPIYHLEIDSEGNIRLHKEIVYNKIKRRKYEVDSLTIGYYQGKLDNSTLEDLIESVQTCNLNSLEFDGITCCDGSIKTIIIYFNGKRKFLKSMFPPRIANNLIEKLIELCEIEDLEKIDEKFHIEKEAGG
jgi:hypothetical protein